MNREKIIADVFGFILIFTAVITCLILAAPVHVLKDWKIKTDKTTYSPNGIIDIQSTSTKLRKSSGKVTRTIECNTGKDNTTDYNLNLSTGSRKPGHSTSTYALKIPGNVTGLPATCRVVVAVNYKVYLFRHITENAVSNDFKVIME